MSRQNTYAVPIKTEVVELHMIEASSAAEAAFRASQARHETGTTIEVNDVVPGAKVTTVTSIGSVRPVVDEEQLGEQLQIPA